MTVVTRTATTKNGITIEEHVRLKTRQGAKRPITGVSLVISGFGKGKAKKPRTVEDFRKIARRAEEIRQAITSLEPKSGRTRSNIRFRKPAATS